MAALLHSLSLFLLLVVALQTSSSHSANSLGTRGVARTVWMNSNSPRGSERETSREISMSAGPPRKFIIAGAPAAGKGTQCAFIQARYGVVHLSTGDLLRAAVKEGTPLGVKAKGFMDAGQLVPDELITDVVCSRLNQADCREKGWLLDGFPRTRSQAEALSAAGQIPDAFVLLDVPEQVLVERVTGRRTDPETGAIYHLKFKPPPAEVLPRLVQRSDDTEEKIVVRYKEFKAHVEEVRSLYQDRLVWVDGSAQHDIVTKCLLRSLARVAPHDEDEVGSWKAGVF